MYEQIGHGLNVVKEETDKGQHKASADERSAGNSNRGEEELLVNLFRERMTQEAADTKDRQPKESHQVHNPAKVKK
jgi:hypothetical protein